MSTMRQIEERVIEEAHYIVEADATIRQTAEHFRTPKSTIHIDVTRRLEAICPPLACEVHAVLTHNLEERAHRAGDATRRRWLKLKRESMS